MRNTSRWLMPALSLILFFGAIGVAQAAGWWVTSGRQAVAAGEMTVDDLKGWMTLKQAADGLGVPVEDLVALVEAPEGAAVEADTAFKDIEGLVPGFELTAYREKVQAYLDERAGVAPAAAAATLPTTLPTSATADATTAPATPVPTTTHVPTGTPTGTQKVTPTGTPEGGVRGSMTLQEVADANGVALDRLLEESGLPADLDAGTVLREIQNVVPGFEIQTIRDAVAELVG
jgi:hypothetical protein